MANENIKNLQLTDDTVKNIQIMAPLLDKDSQNQVYGLIFGIVMGLKDETVEGG